MPRHRRVGPLFPKFYIFVKLPSPLPFHSRASRLSLLWSEQSEHAESRFRQRTFIPALAFALVLAFVLSIPQPLSPAYAERPNDYQGKKDTPADRPLTAAAKAAGAQTTVPIKS